MTRLITAGLLAAVAVAGVQSWRLSSEQAAHADTRAKHSEQIAAMAEAARQAEADARTEEQRRTAEVQKAANEARKAMERARADAVAAADAGDRLRKRIAAITAASCTGASGADAASGGAPADATAGMLADVQRRIDDATNRIAEFADSAHAAGRACESGYNALTP
jgi:hypothetical protein